MEPASSSLKRARAKTRLEVRRRISFELMGKILRSVALQETIERELVPPFVSVSCLIPYSRARPNSASFRKGRGKIGSVREKRYRGFLSGGSNEYIRHLYLNICKNNPRVRAVSSVFPRPLAFPSPAPFLPGESSRGRGLAGKSNLSFSRIDLRHFRFCAPRKTRTIGSTTSGRLFR